MSFRRTFLTSAAAVAAALAVSSALAESTTLTAGDIATVDQWYGRAGGLVGAARVAGVHPNASNPGIGVTYDRDVAARTNMSTDRTGGQGVTVTYDKDVAARTNMVRDTQPVQAAEIPGAKSN